MNRAHCIFCASYSELTLERSLARATDVACLNTLRFIVIGSIVGYEQTRVIYVHSLRCLVSIQVEPSKSDLASDHSVYTFSAFEPSLYQLSLNS